MMVKARRHLLAQGARFRRLFRPLFKTTCFSLMCNASIINKIFQFVAESMIFVFSWIELILHLCASNDLLLIQYKFFYILVVRTIRDVVEN